MVGAREAQPSGYIVNFIQYVEEGSGTENHPKEEFLQTNAIDRKYNFVDAYYKQFSNLTGVCC